MLVTPLSSSPSSVAEFVSLTFQEPCNQLIIRITVYIFVGSLLIEVGIMDKIIGTIVGAVGIAYVALEFIPSIEPPQNMREADGGWGAEQV